MKEVKILDREQACLSFIPALILATIQENGLKSELAKNNCFHISQQFTIHV